MRCGVLEMHQAGKLQVARSVDDTPYHLPFDGIKGVRTHLRVDDAEAFRHDLLWRQRNGCRHIAPLVCLHMVRPVFPQPHSLQASYHGCLRRPRAPVKYVCSAPLARRARGAGSAATHYLANVLGVEQLNGLFIEFHILAEGNRCSLGPSDQMEPAPGLTRGVKLFHDRLMVFKGVHFGEIIVAHDLGETRSGPSRHSQN